MAIQFSNVTLSSGDKLKDFLVCGIPSRQEDLEGWTGYQSFMEQLPDGAGVHADVDTYLYGGEDVVVATPEEVAYMTMRSSRDYRFLPEHCRCVGESGFDFSVPEQRSGMEMNL